MKIKILVCAYLLTAAIGLYAENSTNEVQTLTIKAKRELLDPKNTTLDTTIITSEEIEATGANNLAEVLKYVPGVIVRDSMGSQVVQIRGGRHEQTLILINGVRQQTAQNAFMDLSKYNTANIERIEIIKGSAAIRYGGNAAAGAINIITKDHIENSGKNYGIEASVRYGSYNQIVTDFVANAGYGINNQGNFFVSGYMQNNPGNYMINDDTDLGTFNEEMKNNEIFGANINLGNSYSFNEKGDTLHTSFGYFYENKNSPSSYYDGYTPSLGFPTNSGYEYKTYEYSGNISYEHYSLDTFDFFIAASTLYQTIENLGDAAWTHNTYDNVTTEASFSVDRTDNFYDGTFIFQNLAEILYRNEYFMAGEVTLGTATFIEGDTANRNTISLAYTPNLGFLNYEGTDVSRIIITPGMRFDAILDFNNINSSKSENTFFQPTYFLGAMYTFDSERRYIIKANVNTGYRAPTFNDLYASGGNTDLDIESSLGGDVGFIINPVNIITVSASYFINQYTNFIAWVPDSTGMVWSPENVDKYLNQGVDASIALNIPIEAIFSTILITANYTYLFEAKGSSAGSGDFRMPFAPEHTATGIVSYIFEGPPSSLIRCQLNFLANYSSEMFTAYDELQSFGAKLDGYYTFDITASLTLVDYITIEGGVRNLLDYRYDYAENFQAPGREWYVSVSGKF